MEETGLPRELTDAIQRVNEALTDHARLLSTSSRLQGRVMEASERTLFQALEGYTRAIADHTGFAIFAPDGLPSAFPSLDEPFDEPLDADERPMEDTDRILLRAEWHFDVLDKQRLIAAGTQATRDVDDIPTNGSAAALDVPQALIALFDRDVIWPPPEYSDYGLDIDEVHIEAGSDPDTKSD